MFILMTQQWERYPYPYPIVLVIYGHLMTPEGVFHGSIGGPQQ